MTTGLDAAVGGDIAAVDRALAEDRIIVMAGPGGVGKTTIGAALGLRAAQLHDRRVVVVTVDPARRLAEALGVARLTEEAVLVPVGRGEGRLWALMVDMAKSWDDLVIQHAPDPETARRLLANGLYRTLTRRFIQSHDYIALDHLLSLTEGDRYDLVIVDTPPSSHAIDLLDAPGRMIEFFESRLLRWLTFGAGSSLSTMAAKPFLLLAERLLGSDFLSDIMEFFTLFAELRPTFVKRAEAVERRLADDETVYVVVSTTDPVAVGGCQGLIDGLQQRRRSPELLVVNRLPPTLGLVEGVAGRGHVLRRLIDDEMVALIDDRSLAAAVRQLADQASQAVLPVVGADCPVLGVPLSTEDLTDLDGLASLLSAG